MSMPERSELVAHTEMFTWRHPDNGCAMLEVFPFIRESITAYGPSVADASRYARVLAENSPKLCDVCKENYRLIK